VWGKGGVGWKMKEGDGSPTGGYRSSVPVVMVTGKKEQKRKLTQVLRGLQQPGRQTKPVHAVNDGGK